MPRLQKESVNMEKYDQNGIRFEMVEPLKQWKVFLTDFDKDSIIHSQLDKYGYKEVVMEITIKDNYPFMPPFVRIVEPRFSGYRGFITTGGSLCVDILTITGWVPSFNLISLTNQLKVFIKSGLVDPVKHMIPYTREEAENHYKRTTRIHGWDTE